MRLVHEILGVLYIYFDLYIYFCLYSIIVEY